MTAASPAAPWAGAAKDDTTLDRRTAPADRRWLVLVVVAVAQLTLPATGSGW